MAHAENTVTVNRPIDEVFRYLADGTNNPRWRDGVLEIERTSPTEYRQVLKGPGGRRIAGDYRVTREEAPHLLEFAVTAGPARPTGRFALAAEGADATRVTFTLDLTPKGLMRLMNGMVEKTMTKEVGQLTKLKQVLER